MASGSDPFRLDPEEELSILQVIEGGAGRPGKGKRGADSELCYNGLLFDITWDSTGI
jgi:hypothetical protein